MNNEINNEENLPQEIIEELQDDEEIDLDALNKLDELSETQEPPTKVNIESPNTEKMAGLMSEIIAAKQQYEERDSQYKRLYADFDNFRKRTEREKEEQEDVIGSKILKKFLPVVDDFERAQSQLKPKTEEGISINNSYQSVYKQLVKSLKEAGVVRMRAVETPFDPNYHEAIAQEPSNEFEEGTVMDELRPGYLLGDRILRHALVRVAMAMPESHDPVNLEPESPTSSSG
jgi:molecular chaperone GrpE